MKLTAKQAEYIRNMGRHRWGFKTGAVRSGKTFLDVAYTIPANIRSRKGKAGLCVILGNTKGTIQRNIIEPMRELYGAELVGDIRADNTANLFGERVFCLGADNAAHMNRIRGASFKYCYGDEVATWDRKVFEMLKSRLDKPYSRFDGTCNPEAPQHWLKKFLDSEADIYCQKYALDDNDFLDPNIRETIKRDYAGSVFYDRYVLGLWIAAEGVIYRAFADNPQKYILKDLDPAKIAYCVIGVDFGGHGSAHSFTLTGFTPAFNEVVILDEWYHKGELTPGELEAAFIAFCKKNAKVFPLGVAYADNAEPTLIKGLQEAAALHVRETGGVSVFKCAKKPIKDRISTEIRLFSAGRLFILEHCKNAIEAFSSAVWDEKNILQDVRLDNGTTNIDSLDSFEYSFERNIAELNSLTIRRGVYGT